MLLVTHVVVVTVATGVEQLVVGHCRKRPRLLSVTRTQS